MHTVFEYEITVGPEHVDDQQHVNNVAYVQLMQDIAYKHWNSVTPTDKDAQVFWVVRRHEIDYLAPAFLHDVLMIRTWTGEHTAATWNRHCEIVRMGDQKKIITSKSVWVLLDKLTTKPRRIDDTLLQRFHK